GGVYRAGITVVRYPHAPTEITPSLRAAQVVHKLLEAGCEVRVLCQRVFDALASVHHGGVVAATELLADAGQRCVGEFTGQVHGNLAGERDTLRPALGAHLFDAQPEVFGRGALDQLDRNGTTSGSREQGLEDLRGQVYGDRGAGQAGVRDHADQRALEFADVGLNALGDKLRDLVRYAHAVDLGFLAQNGDARLQVRRLDVGDESPLEPGAQAVFQCGDLLGRAVAGDDDLPAGLVQCIEGVKELLLCAFLAGQELDVVDEQHVHAPILRAELQCPVVADGVNQFVGKLLAGDVRYAVKLLAVDDVVPDGLQQVGFAEA